MWIGEQEVDLQVVAGGETIKQVDSFEYFGGTVCEHGGSSQEVERRLQAGAVARRRVEGSMWHRKLVKQVKGKGLEAYVVPACVYGLGTHALTERQEKLQVAEKSWVRRMCKLKREDRRTLGD